MPIVINNKIEVEAVDGFRRLTDTMKEMIINIGGGTFTPTGLAEKIHANKSTVSKYINELNMLQLIEEKREGRSKKIELTKKGKELYQKLNRDKNKFALVLLL